MPVTDQRQRLPLMSPTAAGTLMKKAYTELYMCTYTKKLNGDRQTQFLTVFAPETEFSFELSLRLQRLLQLADVIS